VKVESPEGRRGRKFILKSAMEIYHEKGDKKVKKPGWMQGISRKKGAGKKRGR